LGTRMVSLKKKPKEGTRDGIEFIFNSVFHFSDKQRLCGLSNRSGIVSLAKSWGVCVHAIGSVRSRTLGLPAFLAGKMQIKDEYGKDGRIDGKIDR